MRKLFFDMDGTLAKWNTVSCEDELYEKGYYRNLEPMKNVVEAVNILYEQGEDEIYILSSVLSDSEYALQEKKEWIKEHMPFMDLENCLFVPYGQSKAEYIIENSDRRRITLNSDYVLVDDYTKNLKDWNKHNGVAIKLMNGINNTKGTWLHEKVFSDKRSEWLALDITDRCIKTELALCNGWMTRLKNSEEEPRVWNEIQLREYVFDLIKDTLPEYSPPLTLFDITNYISYTEMEFPDDNLECRFLDTIEKYDVQERFKKINACKVFAEDLITDELLTEYWKDNALDKYKLGDKKNMLEIASDWKAYQDIICLFDDVRKEQEAISENEIVQEM